MPLKSLTSQLARWSGKVPLRLILVVPFVVQIFAAVGLTGWLSFRNGQRAVDDLGNQLLNEVTNRIEQRLNTYLATPHLFNQMNADAIKLKLVDLNDPQSLERYFWQQIQSFDFVNTVQFGNEQGDYIGAGRLQDGRLTVKVSNLSTERDFHLYATDAQGRRTRRLRLRPNYDPRLRPWYQAPAEMGKPVWSEVYIMFSHGMLGLTLAEPLYNDQNELIGVLGTDVLLSEISEFLRGLKVGRTGKTFIIDRSGFLVAGSSTAPTFSADRRLSAIESSDALIQTTAKQVSQKLGDLTQIDRRQQLTFRFNGKAQQVRVIPFSDRFGLDWLIFIVIAEEDFMARIHENTRTSIFLCVGALVLATGLGAIAARWITRPILRLGQASQAIASGKLDQTVETKGAKELKVLAKSFNQMAEQLRGSFAALAKTNEELEQRVEERTKAFRLSQLKFSKAFRSSPDSITLSTLKDGRFIEVNKSFLKLTGYTLGEAMGRSSIELNIWLNPVARPEMIQQLQTDGAVRNYEFALRTKLGNIKQCQLSAEIVELDGEDCLLAVIHDITELKQAEEALRQKEEYLRLILDNIPQQVFWKDTNLVFQGCNTNWAKAARIESPEAVVGKTDYDLLPTTEAAEFYRAQDCRIMETDSPELHAIERKRVAANDGKPVWLDVSKVPIHDSEGTVIGILGVVEDITQRKQAEEALQAEQKNSEQLLLNILPKPIVEQLKKEQIALTTGEGHAQHKAPIASAIAEATILFADIVDFTPMASQVSPTQLVNLLSQIFSSFDQLAEQYGLEKIKTIGDAYMVAGGLPVPRDDHADAIAEMALEMQSTIANFQRYDRKPFRLRIGINTGPVVAGVIGMKKFIYDLWGDAVNVASRMETQGEPGGIQVTAATYERLRDKYAFEERGIIAVKGKGRMATYWLTGRRTIIRS